MREHGVPEKKEGEMTEEMTEEITAIEEKDVTEETPEEIPVASMTLSADYVNRLDSLTQEVERLKSAEGGPKIVSEYQIQVQTDPSELQKDLQMLTAIAAPPAEITPEEKSLETDQAILDLAKKAAEGPVSLEDFLAGLSDVFDTEGLLEKAKGEREKLQAAAKARASRYNISVKESGNLTPPKGYPSAESEYGDPVNYKYPADSTHARAALGYFNHEGQMTAGGYSSSEWSIIGTRLARLISRHLPATYTYSAGKLKPKQEKMLEQVSTWVKSIWEKVCPTPPSPFFITKEQSDGTFRWVFVSSTAFRDREREIVSVEGVAKSISRADESHQRGPLFFWHTPVQLGTCDFQAQSGIALVESGLWDTTPVAKAAMTSTMQNPPNWGVSIGFLPLASQEGVIIKGAKVNRLWTDLQIVERSILPSSEAASLFTQIVRGQTMEQKKQNALVELLGGDLELVEKVLSATKDINEKASEPDAVFKEANETQPEGEKAQSAPAEEIKEVESVEEVVEDPSAAVLAAISALGLQVKALDAEVKAFRESSDAPRITLHRPVSTESSEAETKDTNDEDITPNVVKSIGAAIGAGR